LSAHANGVVVSGAESPRRHQSEALVVSFGSDGRERFRVTLKDPPSTTQPPRAAATAVAVAPAGVYVLTISAQLHGPTRVQLTLLDETGKARFTTPLELSGQAAPALLADSEGNVIVAGAALSGGSLGIVKYTPEGVRSWSKTFEYTGDIPLLTESRGRLVLAASFQGAARFHDQRVEHTGKVEYRCGAAGAACDDASRALLVVELDSAGNALRTRVFGSPASRISVSDLKARPDGGVFVTGEFSGPSTAVGQHSLCELEAGMPPADSSAFRELGAATSESCDCRKDQRDLFLLQLGPDFEPAWVKTLALGMQRPRLAPNAAGELSWAARTWHVAQQPAAGRGVLSLWRLDASGQVRSRHIAERTFALLASAADATYISDGRRLLRTRL
jgi:hypothetical protein